MLPGDERVLVHRRSPFHPLYLTEDAQGQRTLRFGEDGVRQSVMHPDAPGQLVLEYTRLLPATLALIPPPRRLLCVGLGGGSLPRFFHHTFPELSVEVVELDAGVVQVACEHFGLVEDARLQVHVADGRDFIEAHPERWDVILLDAYDADRDAVPEHLSTLEFLHSVQAALTPSGMAVANVWGRETNPRYEDAVQTFGTAFPCAYLFDVPQAGTKLFAGLQEPRVVERPEVLKWARQLKRERRLTYELAPCVAGFWPLAQERTRGGGRVLRDGGS